jgi:GNAT superfamily N-acetyltransferase/catechol 2,3-dioxygenase-like lactoylglutathione lyase family enzyme
MIHHVQLACPAGSEDTLRDFYGGVLGFREVAKPPVLAARGGCWFRGHGIELHFGVEQDFRPARKAHPGLRVHDLDAWADRLRAAGAPVLFDDDFPGMRRFYSEDPHGNRLEFLEPRPGAVEILETLNLGSTRVVLRRAQASDVPAIIELIAADQLGVTRDGVRSPADLAAYQGAFEAIDRDPAHLLVVGQAGADIVATMQLSFLPGLARRGALRAQIEAVRIDQAYRGHGLGSAIISWAIGEARRRDCALVQLTSDKSRTAAHRFYERLGFVATHEGMKLTL